MEKKGKGKSSYLLKSPGDWVRLDATRTATCILGKNSVTEYFHRVNNAITEGGGVTTQFSFHKGWKRKDWPTGNTGGDNMWDFKQSKIDWLLRALNKYKKILFISLKKRKADWLSSAHWVNIKKILYLNLQKRKADWFSF